MAYLRILVTLAAMIVLSACTALASPTFVDDDVAILGYDSVAYHTQSKAVKGAASHSYEYNDAVWWFSNAENRTLFQSDPTRYAPMYGGYCAYAMSKGYVVSGDPNAWTVVDEKLFLNFSQSVRTTWLKDIHGYVREADANWHEKVDQDNFE